MSTGAKKESRIGLKMYKIEVGDVVKAGYKNQFVIVVQFMHGDADSYSIEKYPGDEDHVRAFLEFMDEYAKLSWNQRGNHENVLKIPGYYKVFTSYETEEDIKKDWGEDYWPYDVTCDDHRARFESFSIYYYDSNGTKHFVNTSKEEDDA